MFHTWLITIRCEQCKAEYKIRMPVLPAGIFDPHRGGHCTPRRMKEMLFPKDDLMHEDCPACHPELAPLPVVRWKGRKSHLPVWTRKVEEDGTVVIELVPPKPSRKR
jgi:hypothetical protein